MAIGRLSLLATVLLVTSTDTVQAQQAGIRWSVEDPPTLSLQEKHGIVADGMWLENIQLGALQLGGCAASIVSATGLAATSLGCARTFMDGPLLDTAFVARSRSEELRLPDIEAYQLVGIYDEAAYLGGDAEEDIVVEYVSVGFRKRVFVYRQFLDVRLVFTPDPGIAFFGFASTYPRYGLDIAFFRLHDSAGEPAQVETYFDWTNRRVPAGEAVFAVESPLSVSDGNVEGFAYNGTVAPPYTTYFGLYDLRYSHGADSIWALPESWQGLQDSLDLSVQLNFVSTASCPESATGAPILNRDLEVVGVAIGEHRLTAPNGGIDTRCVAVSAAGIVEALRVAYGADGILDELEEQALPDS